MKTETKHTPGPWRATLERDTFGKYVDFAIWDNHIPSRPIASLHVGGSWPDKPEQRLNARLIAAAPELLAACVAALAWLGAEAENAYDNHDAETYSQLFDTVAVLNAAITKALGQEVDE